MRKLGDSVIANGAQEGSAVSLGDMDSVTLVPPAAFTGAVAVEISADDTQTWAAVGDAGSPVAIVGGQSVTLIKIHGTHVRVNSDMNEAAERTTAVFGSRGK